LSFSLEDDRRLLRSAITEAADIALSYAGRKRNIVSKLDGSPVTDADLAVDAVLREQLCGPRPGYGWLSEESADLDACRAAERFWLVDPIDGTRTFIAGKAEWVVGVALIEDGIPVASALMCPVKGELFEAGQGQGSTLNGKPIHVSDAHRLDQSRVTRAGAVGLSLGASKVAAGCTLYRFALVAKGAADVAYSLTPKHAWDVAAGVLLVAEAGGAVSDMNGGVIRIVPGETVNGFAAANPGLQRAVLHAIGNR
jgi:myo-inositol-1(or 4)-monophosphatase